MVNIPYSYLLSRYVKYCWPSTDLCWQWCNTIAMFWCIMPILTSCDTSASFEHKTSLSFIVLSIQPYQLQTLSDALVEVSEMLTVRCFNVHREIISIIMWQSCDSHVTVMWYNISIQEAQINNNASQKKKTLVQADLCNERILNFYAELPCVHVNVCKPCVHV